MEKRVSTFAYNIHSRGDQRSIFAAVLEQSRRLSRILFLRNRERFFSMDGQTFYFFKVVRKKLFSLNIIYRNILFTFFELNFVNAPVY